MILRVAQYRGARVNWAAIDRTVEQLFSRCGDRRARSDREFALVLRVLAATLRVGATLPQALARAADRCTGSVARECASTAARLRLGASVEDELAAMAIRLDLSAAQLLAQIVAVQHRRGGDLARPCTRLAALVDERLRLDTEARTATAQARFAGRAVVAIPALLALAAWWRAPSAVERLVSPGVLLIATPGLLAIVLGSIIAAKIGRAAAAGVVMSRPKRTRASRRAVRRIAGTGAQSRASARLGMCAAAICIPLVVLVQSAMAVFAGTVMIGVAIVWPWAEQRARRVEAAKTADTGIESLLEVSIALFTAGATAHDVARLAPPSIPDPLRAALQPAVDRLALGRSIPSAFGDLPVVSASPHMDAWLHAVCSSADLGAASVDVLERLLHDARAARREAIRSTAATAAPRMQIALVLLVVPGIMWVMLVATVGSLVDQLQSAGVV